MKFRTFYLLLFLLAAEVGFAQNSPDSSSERTEDQLITALCEDFKANSGLGDSLRVATLYSKHIFPYLERTKPENVDSIGTAIFVRLQKQCLDFRQFLLDRTPTKHWRVAQEMPTVEFSKKDQKEFSQLSNFYYYEGGTGKVTQVQISKGIWRDIFPDNTYSKNKITWISDHEFVLEHIESNNEARKAFSRKGEKYNYTVVKKGDGFYSLAVKIPEQSEILLFKLYLDYKKEFIQTKKK